MHRGTADRFAAVVGAERHRIGTVDQPLVGPVKLRLMGLVGSEFLERPPVRSRVERNDREAGLGQLAGKRAATRARADDGEVDRFVFGVFAHRHPGAGPKYIGRTAVRRAHFARSISGHVR